MNHSKIQLLTKKEIALKLRIRTQRILHKIPNLLDKLELDEASYKRIKIFNLEQTKIIKQLLDE